jgi:hypothetical protein
MLGKIFQVSLLLINAIAVLSEDRFLSRRMFPLFIVSLVLPTPSQWVGSHLAHLKALVPISINHTTRMAMV